MNVINDYSNYDVMQQQCLKLQNLDETISKTMLFEIKNYYEAWDEKIRRYNAGGRRGYTSHGKRFGNTNYRVKSSNLPKNNIQIL